MKRALITVFQFILFFLTFTVGSFLPPFKLRHIVSVTPTGTRLFFWDGLVLMLMLFALILVMDAARKKLREAAPWTTLALVLATAVGLAFKLGFMTIDQ